MTGSGPGIESMKLYTGVDRIYNELRARGLDAGAALAVEDLTPFDQYHYHGTEAVDHAAHVLGIDVQSRVLEVGSGIGGPARCMADRTGCHVTALELQADLHAVASDLTTRCGLSNRIEHVHGDILDANLAGGFDAVVSWLALYHIADNEALLARCRSLIADGGGFYCEDLVERAAPDRAQRTMLDDELYARHLCGMDPYRGELENAGFVRVAVEDMSEDWTAFCHERLAAFRRDKPRQVAVHGQELADSMEAFYTTVDALFGAGVLGGMRVSAWKG